MKAKKQTGARARPPARAKAAPSIAPRLARLQKKWQAGIDAAVDAALLCAEHHELNPPWVKKTLDLPYPRKPFADEEAQLDALGKAFADGQGFALFEALELCLSRGWIIPTWAITSLYVGNNRFRAKEVAQFGEAFSVKPHAKSAVSKRRARHKRPSLEVAALRFGIFGTAEELARHLLLNNFPRGHKFTTADYQSVAKALARAKLPLEWSTVKRIWLERQT